MCDSYQKRIAFWGFKQKQILTWVKTTMNEPRTSQDEISEDLKLSFGMGRIFRCADEHALVGTKGKVSDMVKNHGIRNAFIYPNLKNSAKPDTVTAALDKMFPAPAKKLELFARRSRPGWVTLGNECPSTMGQDIRESLQNLTGAI
jgi:N6-adenosine-specific RNA methylase IME4